MKTKSPRVKFILPLVIATLVISCIIWAVFAVLSYSSNPAEQVAKPLEVELVKAGATKICTLDDPGKESDNNEPWYEARLQFDKSVDETAKIIDQAASNNDYVLKRGDSPYPSIVWYTDTNKNSDYRELNQGKIRLSISTYSDTSTKPLYCPSGTGLIGDANHTAVTLSVSLPSRK